MSYFNTLIQVAEDCPVACGVVPVARGGKKTVAAIQFDLLMEKPYYYTQEELLFEVFARHKEVPALRQRRRGRPSLRSRSRVCASHPWRSRMAGVCILTRRGEWRSALWSLRLISSSVRAVPAGLPW